MNTKRLNNNEAEEQGEHRLEKAERETHYIFNEADGYWIADSTLPRDIHKLEKQHWIETSVQYYKDGTVMAKQFKAPRNCLSPRDYNPNKPKREMSAEHKAKVMEALTKSREKKKQNKN
mgnify:CR=1 FL=1